MYWAEFFTIAIAHLFAVASPGPDFAVVMRQCITGGTRSGLWTSFGVGTGILLHVSYCLLGVALLLSSSPGLFDTVKIVAALYLLYLGLQSLRASFKPAVPATQTGFATGLRPIRAFLLGFFTNGLNPKATLFFLALFTLVIDPGTPLGIQIVYGIYLALATFAWFASLSLLMGRQDVRGFVLKAGVWFERGMGIILLALAAQLLLSRS
jgi:threonine/homoserine/homoserine lactone efflux protein